MSESSNRFEDGLRKLDSLKAASMDYRQLAALVSSMKKPVTVAKRNVINKLSRRIKMLKSRKDAADDNVSNKAERLVEEIGLVKAMDMTRIAKFSLANEDSLDSLSKKGKITPHLLCLTRLSEDKLLKDFVQKWRLEHSDWRILANFILSKNSSRHFKRSVQKQKITRDSLLVEKELIHKRLGTQVGEVSARDVNEPLVERTSKGKKFKKKGREFKEQPTPELTSDRLMPDEESDAIDEEGRGNNPDDDLYTFNIVEDDLDRIEQEGQEVSVSQGEKSIPVAAETKLIAHKLFSAGPEANSPSETDSDVSDDITPVNNVGKPSPSTEETTTVCPSITLKGQAVTCQTTSLKTEPTTRRAINNRKPKSKKSNVDSTSVSAARPKPVRPLKLQTKKLTKVERETTEDTPTEMVKAVIDIEELASKNIDAITSTDACSSDNKASRGPRRKKSAFFLGGQDEIDESLGTSVEEQERARKNQKVAGYKGLRNTEKKWLSSTFTESLKTNSKPPWKKLKLGEKATGNVERTQRSSHQSQKFTSKQKTGVSSKDSFAGNVKSGAKTFNPPSQKSKPEPVESLHPSWQASKRRKEQLELIKKGPQGKKITFDDD